MVVTPQPKASRLEAPRARNYVLQTICPFELADHTLIVGEKLFVQLTLDALAHPGPAVRERIGKPKCGFIPETATVGPIAVTFAAGTATTSAATATPVEPPLRDYLK
jgi:hypothetical protein